MEPQLKSLVNIEDEMRQSYMDYAMSVIVGRALPDVRDGLKPVQRRVLYAMFGEGLVSNKKHSKCAGVVGEVLKRLHPHGDSSVYEALVRLAQPWSLRYPLVDGQGNFGSIDGDPAAAYRYTECRMTALSEKLLEDIEKDTVDFIPNFDDSNIEPVVLPSTFPNLLVNGADGIAVGMATHIPPHNLNEVLNGVIAMLENPNISLTDLMQHIPGPDFPTGGTIYGRGSIAGAYATGKGVLQIRAKTSIEAVKQKSREGEAIVVHEIPFQVNKARLIERIADLVNEKQIEGIARIRDESDRSGMRIVMELKRDATAEVVLNQLFKLTPMQTSFGIINLAIVEGQPVICSLAKMLGCFIDHRRDVVTRRTQFDLKKAQERMHILEGFRIALLNIDEVIQIIKKSETPKDAKGNLNSRFKLSDIQSQAILDLRLQKLTGMERLAVEQEHEELAKEIARLLGILSDSRKVDALITSELLALREKFGDARRTEIIDDGGEIMVEDLIEDEEMVVSISHKGYAKRTSTSNYRSQKRGGKGVAGAASNEEDFIEHLFVTSTLADLLVFTSLGRLYWLKVYEIPEAGRTARGRALINLLQLKSDETITAILPVRQFVENRYIMMATRLGTVKKVDLMEFSRSRKSGIIACGLNEGDALIMVAETSGSDEIILATKTGMAIRFLEEEVRPMGRSAVGVRGIKLDDGDAVVGMTVVAGQTEGATPSENEPTLLTVCENGYGKRTKLSDYRAQGRGGKGVIDIQTEGRNGPAIGICSVNGDSGVMLITSSGKIIRMDARDISVIGRNTMGVRLMNLDEGEKAVAIAHLMENEGEASAETEE
ncbi:MAG: DNA gyrase subunit A [Deltaproteobacteria bacterium]|nr:DNA gyrase subunit A [Deltaproteobacteria bacterium]